MFTKVLKLKNIGIFKDYHPEQATPDFGKINLIYGYNGTGKTTITNIFNLLSETDKIKKEELLDDIKNSTDYSIEYEFDGKHIKYSNDCIYPSLRVFNHNFIVSHIYDGNTSNMKGFNKEIITKDQLKNKDISTLENEISVKTEDLEKYKKVVADYEKKYDEIKKHWSQEFNKNIKNARLTKWGIPTEPLPDDYNKLLNDLAHFYAELEMSQNGEETRNALTKLRAIKLEVISFDASLYKEVVNRIIMTESNEYVKTKIKELELCKLPNKESITDWYKNGNEILKHNQSHNKAKCPLCDSNIEEQLTSLIGSYNNYFNDEYNKLIDNIDALIGEISTIKASIEDNSGNIILSIDALNKYLPIQDNENKPKPEKLKMPELFKTYYTELETVLINKKNNINNTGYNEDALQGITELIEVYNSQIIKMKESLDNIINDLSVISPEPNKIIDRIKDVIVKIGNIDFHNYQNGDSISNYNDTVKHIGTMNDEIVRKKRDLEILIAKMRDESKYVNDYLRKLGVHHFSIDLDSTKQKDNIKILYNNGSIKAKIGNSLSEGEKTTLAFAYFLSKYRYEVIDNPEMNESDSCLVIDDPISSLDENRLYTTAYIIKGIFNNIKQLFVFSHNLIFMKYLGNIIDDKDRKDFLMQVIDDNPQICELPKSLTNYITSYYNKLEDIIKYSENGCDYENAKKYLPSYIRVVLETFLAFKFYVVKQGTGGGKHKTPGLDKLIDVVEGNKGKYAQFAAIDDLNSENLVTKLSFIKEVTDPQCHGTQQNIESFNYISKEELTNVVKDTVNIIKFMDGLHYERMTTN